MFTDKKKMERNDMDLALRGRTALSPAAPVASGNRSRASWRRGLQSDPGRDDAARLKTVADEIKAAHKVECEDHAVDLSKLENIRARRCGGRLRHPGEQCRRDSARGPTMVTPEAWRHGWDLKVFGYIDMTRFILPKMKARKNGVIINIIGMAGERPEPTTSRRPAAMPR